VLQVTLNGPVFPKPGNKDAAREVLATALARGPLPGREDIFSQLVNSGRRGGLQEKSWLFEAVDLLLKDGSGESRSAARQLFNNPRLKLTDNEQDRVRVLRRFTADRLPDSFDFYLAMLAIKGNELGNATLSQPVAEKLADEITGVFAPQDEEIVALTKKIAKTADRTPAVRRWLAEQANNPGSLPPVNNRSRHRLPPVKGFVF
jgi:hypothetical protein